MRTTSGAWLAVPPGLLVLLAGEKAAVPLVDQRRECLVRRVCGVRPELKCLPGTEHDQAIVACVKIPSKVNWLGPESVALVGPLLPIQRMSKDATDASGAVCLVPCGRNAGNEFANWR